MQLSIASKGSIVISNVFPQMEFAGADRHRINLLGGGGEGVRMPIIIVCKGFQSLAYLGIDPVKFKRS